MHIHITFSNVTPSCEILRGVVDNLRPASSPRPKVGSARHAQSWLGRGASYGGAYCDQLCSEIRVYARRALCRCRSYKKAFIESMASMNSVYVPIGLSNNKYGGRRITNDSHHSSDRLAEGSRLYVWTSETDNGGIEVIAPDEFGDAWGRGIRLGSRHRRPARRLHLGHHEEAQGRLYVGADVTRLDTIRLNPHERGPARPAGVARTTHALPSDVIPISESCASRATNLGVSARANSDTVAAGWGLAVGGPLREAVVDPCARGWQTFCYEIVRRHG